jgi:L-lactate utilization protein LutB
VNYDSLEEENAGLYTERNRLRRENAALKDERKEMKAMFDDLAAELDGLSARFDKAVAAMGGQRPLAVTGDRAAQGAVSERLAPVQAIGGQGNRMNAVVVGGWK